MRFRLAILAIGLLTIAGCSDDRERRRGYRSDRAIYREQQRPTRVIRQEPVRERRVYVDDRPAHRELPRERRVNRDRERERGREAGRNREGGRDRDDYDDDRDRQDRDVRRIDRDQQDPKN